MHNNFDISSCSELQLFREVDNSTLEKVINESSLVEIQIDDYILNIDEANNSLYILLEGVLDVYVKFQEEPISRLFPGQIIGEISLLDKKPISASVKAKENSTLLKFDESLFWYLIENSHSFSKNIVSLLAEKLRTFNDQVSNVENNKRNIVENHIDNLTGLYNREWFDMHFPIEVENAQMKKTSLIIIMFEFDETDPKMGSFMQELSKNLQLEFRGFQHLSRFDRNKIITMISRGKLKEVKKLCKNFSDKINEDTTRLNICFSQLTPIDTTETIIEKTMNLLRKKNEVNF